MKLGKRKHKLATCLLSHSKELPAHLSGIVEVSQVFTPEDKRKQGRARALLTKICQEADDCATVLMLMPDEGLVDFYAWHGFRLIQDNPPLMARPIINAAKRCEHDRQTN